MSNPSATMSSKTMKQKQPITAARATDGLMVKFGEGG